MYLLVFGIAFSSFLTKAEGITFEVCLKLLEGTVSAQNVPSFFKHAFPDLLDGIPFCTTC